jgi:predicted glycoside hydrolase/deacetylase ChbG (UPF0249 family)
VAEPVIEPGPVGAVGDPPLRAVIVNADDFGRSAGVNRGVLRAHDEGIVTSASVMVRWPPAREALRAGAARPALSLGLHVDLGEWAYRDGQWCAIYQVVDPRDARAVRDEVVRQLGTFRRLAGRDPTHLDAHQHVHRDEPLRSVLRELAADLGIPLRQFDARIRFQGGFYGQTAEGVPWPEGITVENLVALLQAVPRGWTELACHPAAAVAFETMYRTERICELSVLCDPRLRAVATGGGIRLCSFAEIPRDGGRAR